MIGRTNKEGNHTIRKVIQDKLAETYDVSEAPGISPRLKIEGMNGKYSEADLINAM